MIGLAYVARLATFAEPRQRDAIFRVALLRGDDMCGDVVDAWRAQRHCHGDWLESSVKFGRKHLSDSIVD